MDSSRRSADTGPAGARSATRAPSRNAFGLRGGSVTENAIFSFETFMSTLIIAGLWPLRERADVVLPHRVFRARPFAAPWRDFAGFSCSKSATLHWPRLSAYLGLAFHGEGAMVIDEAQAAEANRLY